jgi:hypothetical protein
MQRTVLRLIVSSAVALAVVAVGVPLRAQAPAPAPKSGAAPATAPAAGAQQAPLSQDKLDSLVAPIALYPDQLLVQVLMAATYPLDVVEAARFIKANKELKGDAMVKAAEAKNWDPSVQALTAYPQTIEMMNDKLEWTQQLGDAVLADQAAVMKTAQRLRAKANEAGNLKSNEQQKVVVQQDKTIIIEPAQPQTVYVPTYNPAVVYGTWWAPMYPPYYWPPSPYYYPGYVAGAAVVGFGVGLAVGAAWGWAGSNWGGNEININQNNNFVRNNNNAEFKNKVQNGNWNHNPSQRKGVAYNDKGTRDKFAKSDAGAASARRDYRGHEGGAGDRAGGAGDRGGGASASQRPAGGGAGQGNFGGADFGSGGGGGRGGAGGGDFNRPSTGGSGSGNFGGGSGGGSGNLGGGGAGSGNFGGGGGASASHHGSSSFNSGMNRTQSSAASNRGASSRSSMSSGASRGGGGGGSRGGGGGGGRGGGRR